MGQLSKAHLKTPGPTEEQSFPCLEVNVIFNVCALLMDRCRSTQSEYLHLMCGHSQILCGPPLTGDYVCAVWQTRLQTRTVAALQSWHAGVAPLSQKFLQYLI
jgi:hypothetical protein